MIGSIADEYPAALLRKRNVVSSSHRFLELIARATYGMNHIRLVILTQFTPQVADIHINNIREMLGVSIPDVLSNHCSAQYLVRIMHKEFRSEEHTSELQSHSFISY